MEGQKPRLGPYYLGQVPPPRPSLRGGRRRAEPPPPLEHDRRSHRWVLWTALVGAGLYFAIRLFPLVRADVAAWVAGGRP